MVGSTKQTASFLAVDLGASSGRVILGRWDGERFDLRELHRFPNGPVRVRGHIYWDVLRLWDEIKTGIAHYAAAYDEPLASIGVDTWAVDFGLLDAHGKLLGNPYHYRDRRTEGVDVLVDSIVPPAVLYTRTGIQRLPINTLYQLVGMVHSGDPQLGAARTLLMIPDLFHYWLTGRTAAEYTNATTTQFLDALKKTWAVDLLAQLGIDAGILPPLVTPGTVLGEVRPEVREEIGLRSGLPAAPVVASATHDTASAVAAVPGLDKASVYISSGTWSLVGVETPRPILTERAQALNFTNEGGVEGTIRFLKNVGGLWLLQECKRLWEWEGKSYTWPELLVQAEGAAPLRSLVDPDDAGLLSPPDMRAAIRAYCMRSGQASPGTVGEVVRCCLESLALKYRWTVRALEELVGHRLDKVRIVGGGSQNSMLCRFTADACNREVIAGPVEATALGNIMVQAVATGYLPDIAAGRRAVSASVEQTHYEPAPGEDWDEAFARFSKLLVSGQVGGS